MNALIPGMVSSGACYSTYFRPVKAEVGRTDIVGEFQNSLFVSRVSTGVSNLDERCRFAEGGGRELVR